MPRLTLNIIAALALVSSLALAVPPGRADEEAAPLRIYVDADFTVTRAPADAIVLGLETALDTVGRTIAGAPIEVVHLDHRGTPKRSHRNMQTVLHDPRALAVIGGMQSPPYLTYGDYINSNGIPLLVAWAAAGPVTRAAEGPENFIFRLSVDDRKAGPFLVQAAIARGCERTSLLFIDTGWGRASRIALNAAMAEAGKTPAADMLVSPETGPIAARSIVYDVAKLAPDCMIAVLTSGPAQEIFRAIAEIVPDLTVLSHWGILGQDRLFEGPSLATLSSLDAMILQTCGLEEERRGNPWLTAALIQARARAPGLRNLSDLQAPSGFVHGYDLGLILHAAARQAADGPAWAGGPRERRAAVKAALEGLDEPVRGILRAYDRPFGTWSAANPDAHEALGLDDLCLARFSATGSLMAVSGSGGRR